jgi:hypothetical protein
MSVIQIPESVESYFSKVKDSIGLNLRLINGEVYYSLIYLNSAGYSIIYSRISKKDGQIYRPNEGGEFISIGKLIII